MSPTEWFCAGGCGGGRSGALSADEMAVVLTGEGLYALTQNNEEQAGLAINNLPNYDEPLSARELIDEQLRLLGSTEVWILASRIIRIVPRQKSSLRGE